MARYKITIKKSAIKELENIPKRELQKIIKRIHSLGGNPRPSGSQKLSITDCYRLRQGNYRIVYSISDEDLTINIFKVGHRREIYRS